MKKAIHSRILLIFISLMLVMMVIPTASATIYTNEDFEDETAGNNPNSGWYTYTENNEFDIDNVTTNSSRTGGTQGFHLYDAGVDSDPFALFTFDTVTYYDTFSFYFNVSRDNHEHLNVSFNDSSGQELARLDIGNKSLWFNSSSPIYTSTIGNNTWYRVIIDFNLTTNRIGMYLYNDTGIIIGYDWGDMEDGAGTYTDVASVKFWSDSSGNKVWVCIDDMSRAYTYINPNAASNLAIVAAITALFAVAILLQIVAVAYSGQVNSYSLIMLLVTIIIGVITLQIVAGL